MIHSNSNRTGVYAIVNKINHFMYVGSTASKQGFAGRLRTHAYELKVNKHHSIILQVHFNRYGEEAFEVWILEECPPKECLRHEQFWLTLNGVGSRNKSYNLTPTAGSTLGIKHSLQAKTNIAAAAKKRVLSPEGKARIAAGYSRWLKETERKPTRENVEKMVARSVAVRAFEYVAVSPEGIEYSFKNLNQFCKKHGLCQKNIVRLLGESNVVTKDGKFDLLMLQQKNMKNYLKRCLLAEEDPTFALLQRMKNS